MRPPHLADVLSLEMVPDAKGSEGMLTVDHYELIRRKVVIEGKSQRDVAKELGHSRETIAKALKLRIPPGYRLSKPRPRPVIEPVTDVLMICDNLRNALSCAIGGRSIPRQPGPAVYPLHPERSRRIRISS